jgi:uncharacterized protein
MRTERCEADRRHRAAHEAYLRGDRDALRDVLNDPLAHGADPDLKTRIDDCASTLEDAEAAGFAEAVALMRAARSHKTQAAR